MIKRSTCLLQDFIYCLGFLVTNADTVSCYTFKVTSADSCLFAAAGKTYPDFLGCAIGVAMTVVLVVGVRKSVRFNNVLNIINLVVWVFIVIAGFFYMDTANWNEGFAPYGASGVSSSPWCELQAARTSHNMVGHAHMAAKVTHTRSRSS